MAQLTTNSNKRDTLVGKYIRQASVVGNIYYLFE